MGGSYDEGRVERLRSGDASVASAALAGLSVPEVAHPLVLRAVIGLLASEDDGLRGFACHRLSEAALARIDIGPALPQLLTLFEDRSSPQPGYVVGREAMFAAACCYLRERRDAELAEMLAQPGELRSSGMSALQFASAEELAPHLGQLQTLFEATPALQRRIAGVLAAAYVTQGAWSALDDLLSRPSGDVRLAVLAALDDAAEERRDIEPVIPSVIARCRDDDAKVRSAAARVLKWLVLRHDPLPRELVLHGVDILAVPAVKAEIRSLERFARRTKDER
jgi:hypothetical protein